MTPKEELQEQLDKIAKKSEQTDKDTQRILKRSDEVLKRLERRANA